MKQILQSLNNGETTIISAPRPQSIKGHLLINTEKTLISPGTERMLVNFGKSSYLAKARQRPDKVKEVIEKIKVDGLIATIDAVQSKLLQPLSLGYCNVGIVSDIGEGVSNFNIGDRVVSNGPHAEVVSVPKNLCVRIPDNVDDSSAAFTVVSSIGLQGIRLANPTLGESFVVIGVGLIGLITIQLLIANGCRVLAIDFDKEKLDLAKSFGADICNLSESKDPVADAIAFSRKDGVDAVLVSASTKSNDPITQAAKMCRKRGRIILIGVSGMNLNRDDFYKKELSLQVSCSYGPGRYDSDYEKNGIDYPIGFVRWTEQRNFEAILDMMSSGKLNVKPLITKRYKFEDAAKVYKDLIDDNSLIGVILEYTSIDRNKNEIIINNFNKFSPIKPIVGFIGAGNYSSRTLIPAFKSSNAQLHTIVSSGGVNSAINAKKFGFTKASTSIDSLLSDENINTISIVTRHNTHADLVIKALSSRKNVFVEKPLALTLDEVANIEKVYSLVNKKNDNIHLMVGFNRRFSPLANKMKSLLDTVKHPKSFIITVNAGFIPNDHWTQDISIGGGRVIGEACHFIDFMRFMSGSEIISIDSKCLGNNTGKRSYDTVIMRLTFADGSVGSIQYFANGSKSFPKERIEVFVAGRVLQLDNFRKLIGFGWPGFSKMSLWRQNKGQKECVDSFLTAVEKGNNTPIPINEIFEVSRFAIQASFLLQNE